MRRASWRTPPGARCRRLPGSIRTSATSTPSGSSPMTTMPRRTSRTARSWCSPSTTRLPPARSGRKRCWSSSMTSTAASSITSRRPAFRTTTRRCSAATGCGYRRWSSRRGSSHARYHIWSWITRRSSRRFCCGSAPKRSMSPSGITGCSGGSRAPDARIPWGRGWRTPMIWGSCSPAPCPGRSARYALIHDAAARAATRMRGAPIDGDPLGLHPATDLQVRIAAAIRELRRRGHPANRP